MDFGVCALWALTVRCQTTWSLKLAHVPCASARICNQRVRLCAWLNVSVVSLCLSMVICMCVVVYSQVCWTPWRARAVRGVRDVSVLGRARTCGIGRAQVAGVLWTGRVVYSVSDTKCNNLRCTSFAMDFCCLVPQLEVHQDFPTEFVNQAWPNKWLSGLPRPRWSGLVPTENVTPTLAKLLMDLPNWESQIYPLGHGSAWLRLSLFPRLQSPPPSRLDV